MISLRVSQCILFNLRLGDATQTSECLDYNVLYGYEIYFNDVQVFSILKQLIANSKYTITIAPKDSEQLIPVSEITTREID